MKKQNGFTLVEIAIVLVIIGLLTGGILKGQQMIENTKYKNLQSQIESYRAAMYAFQDRYRALPGDFAQAGSRLTAPAGVTIFAPPTTNGLIDGWTCSGATEESCGVWQHLILAGLISGNPGLTGAAILPRHTYGGTVDITSGTLLGVSKIWIALGNVPGEVVQRLDDDLDDGIAGSGSIHNNTASATTWGTANVGWTYIGL